MKISIKAETKTKNPSEKELDKTVDEILNLAFKIKNCSFISGRCFRNGTRIVVEKNEY